MSLRDSFFRSDGMHSSSGIGRVVLLGGDIFLSWEGCTDDEELEGIDETGQRSHFMGDGMTPST